MAGSTARDMGHRANPHMAQAALHLSLGTQPGTLILPEVHSSTPRPKPPLPGNLTQEGIHPPQTPWRTELGTAATSTALAARNLQQFTSF